MLDTQPTKVDAPQALQEAPKTPTQPTTVDELFTSIPEIKQKLDTTSSFSRDTQKFLDKDLTPQQSHIAMEFFRDHKGILKNLSIEDLTTFLKINCDAFKKGGATGTEAQLNLPKPVSLSSVVTTTDTDISRIAQQKLSETVAITVSETDTNIKSTDTNIKSTEKSQKELDTQNNLRLLAFAEKKEYIQLYKNVVDSPLISHEKRVSFENQAKDALPVIE
jgi:hypothetical protein